MWRVSSHNGNVWNVQSVLVERCLLKFETGRHVSGVGLLYSKFTKWIEGSCLSDSCCVEWNETKMGTVWRDEQRDHRYWCVSVYVGEQHAAVWVRVTVLTLLYKDRNMRVQNTTVTSSDTTTPHIRSFRRRNPLLRNRINVSVAHNHKWGSTSPSEPCLRYKISMKRS
jgi:hypothetical protein